MEANKDFIRRGMMLVDCKSNPKAAIGFTADISLFEDSTEKAVVWENYEPVVTSQTTHQVCTLDMEHLQPEEIKGEDIEHLRKLSSNKINLNGKKDSVDDIPLPGLGKHKSRSQDPQDRRTTNIAADQDDSIEDKKMQSFSRRKIADMYIKNGGLVRSQSIENGKTVGKRKLKGKVSIDDKEEDKDESCDSDTM
mmetsp:Transcript_36855/g.33090  ORF Transcript_36855/g.33090 Transcript_36855/m.33090 type:complete len:194 (+) Transcript_36855:1697-2278(+)|eukprot:CAMPEP_0114585716 /NCGR_PEP_ID=MMETSP0125-20121206/9170_1 /TAXON_ID=485358 ORGANISM="Aristerostoma sp., Strain ATCC 50986" /NCGR_SAMPLE_ID=MMETSP0125 /ASSEMBLY_ACC=CAM_ASM_000245 /LENGTH=193 /DNA_ID=CAMNT_0001780893 /DNA_START=1702 /DNA_END=2283 /DNA_ORIENTATION=+